MPEQEIIPAGAPMGRPSSYSQAIADEICDRLSVGESLIDITDDDHMPNETTVYRWLRHPDRDDFRLNYAHARENQADHEADEMKRIADDGSNDWMEKRNADGQIIGWTVNGEAVARSKLRHEDRKWRAGQLKPKKWGNKLDLTSDGEPIQMADPTSVAARAAAIMASARERKGGK